MNGFRFTDGTTFVSADEIIPSGMPVLIRFNPLQAYGTGCDAECTDLDGNVWKNEHTDGTNTSVFNVNGYQKTFTHAKIVMYLNPTTGVFMATSMWGGSDYVSTANAFCAVYKDGVRTDGQSTFDVDIYAQNTKETQVYLDYHLTSGHIGTVTVYYVYSRDLNLYEIMTLYGNAGGAYGNVFGNKSFIFNNSYGAYTPPTPSSTDPYSSGGTTGDDETEGTGGGGDYDDTSTPVAIPTVPILTAVDAKFITIFNPSLSELDALASYMWAGLFDVATFKKLFADPMDCILGLSIVPVNVPNGPSTEIVVGNIPTGIYMTRAATQYVTVDCGVLNVNEFWGAYLDYSPYTKCEIYLPYIGTKPIDIDDIMGKSVHVVYHVDILSGACIAYIECGGTVLYSFTGQCASQIPVTGNDLSSIIRGAISIGATMGTMVASGGLTAPMAVVGVASTSATIASAKPQVEKSGSLSGTGGLMGIQTPYLILTRPRQALPENQNEYTGYPSYITRTLSTLQGFTQVESIHLEGLECTKDEMIEIEGLLKTGVIL